MTVPGTSFSAQAENVIVGSPTIGVPALVSMTRPAMRFARKRYDQQRSNASSRRIPWQIKFPAWIAIWWSSGHWHERGKRRGQWVMARPGDIGPYREGNVAIVPNAVNASEGHLAAGVAGFSLITKQVFSLNLAQPRTTSTSHCAAS